MKKIWEMTAAGAMLLSALLPLSALELVKDGKTDYVVVIGENGLYDRFAAGEFTELMQKSTGVEFPRVKSGSKEAAAAPKRIFIGDSPEMREIFGKEKTEKLSNLESIAMEKGDSLAIVGGGNHGTAYGVYHFLEEELGYRCFNPFPGGERIPRYRNLTTSGRELHRKIAFPLFRMRRFTSTGTAGMPITATRNSPNSKD